MYIQLFVIDSYGQSGMQCCWNDGGAGGPKSFLRYVQVFSDKNTTTLKVLVIWSILLMLWKWIVRPSISVANGKRQSVVSFSSSEIGHALKERCSFIQESRLFTGLLAQISFPPRQHDGSPYKWMHDRTRHLYYKELWCSLWGSFADAGSASFNGEAVGMDVKINFAVVVLYCSIISEGKHMSCLKHDIAVTRRCVIFLVLTDDIIDL